MTIIKRYSCSACGKIHPKWTGQCLGCLAWHTISEELVDKKFAHLPQGQIYGEYKGKILDVQRIDSEIQETLRYKTYITELDRVLGGGLVLGSAILIGGEPGIGKSTITMQLCNALGNLNKKCLYISAEESLNQIKLRAERLGISDRNIMLATSGNVEDIIATLDSLDDIDLVIVDSIQTMQTSAIESASGTVSQVKAASNILINHAKTKGIVLILIGHVTKEGQIAGPKLLEHMVDTVLYFENDLQHNLRIIRSMKNRFGPVNELGVFEMTSKGLIEISDPSRLFLSHRVNEAGSVVFAGIEGARPVMVEVQALLAPSHMPSPRRSVVGWDINRLSAILAVLSVRAKLNLSNYEVYLAIAGGFKITDPAIDLAVAAAIISCITKKKYGTGTVFFGEVGLSGEVRKPNFLEQRVREAKKLNFDRIVTNVEDNSDIKCVRHVTSLLSMME